MVLVKLRLQRFGQGKSPYWRIVAAPHGRRRDGYFLEILGGHDRFPDQLGCKHVRLNVERIKYWIAQGAQPTEPVAKLLSKFHLWVPPPVPAPYKADLTVLERPVPQSSLSPSLLCHSISASHSRSVGPESAQAHFSAEQKMEVQRLQKKLATIENVDGMSPKQLFEVVVEKLPLEPSTHSRFRPSAAKHNKPVESIAQSSELYTQRQLPNFPSVN